MTAASFPEIRRQLETALQRGEHPVLCLVGPFLSGKTRFIQAWLQEVYGSLEPYYLNVNRFLLDSIRREGPLEELIQVKAKARLVMQVYLEEAVRNALREQPLLVLDALEILYPYHLDLVTLVRKYARRDHPCILCVPEDPERRFRFAFDWERCHVIRMTR